MEFVGEKNMTEMGSPPMDPPCKCGSSLPHDSSTHQCDQELFKPCPHCGSRLLYWGHHDSDCFAVECHNCGCVGPRISYESAERLGLPVEIRYDELADLDGKLLDFAIEAWNQREHQ
ncbi:hypothetical protein CMI47_11110 [Candidatus Pacearchaeota archaeon]|jgi:hypothetical protein|nr:hypothetical protein [Candidatus Pacearchaeota archaeon]